MLGFGSHEPGSASAELGPPPESMTKRHLEGRGPPSPKPLGRHYLHAWDPCLHPSVPFRHQLRRDADRDLVRMIRPEIQTDGAVEFSSELGRQPVCHQFPAKNLRLRVAANHADKGKLP